MPSIGILDRPESGDTLLVDGGTGSELQRRGIDVLLMCTPPAQVSAGLPLLREAFNGCVGAYPNIGYRPFAPRSGPPYSLALTSVGSVYAFSRDESRIDQAK